MKVLKTALIGAGLLAGTTGAFAADVYDGSLKDTPSFAPRMSWTGFYLGAHVGGTRDDKFDFKDEENRSDFGSGIMPLSDSAISGFHIGYNWQAGKNIVLGIEGDYSFSGSQDLSGFLGTDAIASLRARLGYAFGKTLVYATGGVARLEWSDQFQSAPRDLPFDGTQIGWTAGAGVEHKILSNVSIGVEGLYYAFDDSGTLVNDSGEGRGDLSYDREFWSVRARLNYHVNADSDQPLK
jgi:outer membrane immunogenic protein